MTQHRQTQSTLAPRTVVPKDEIDIRTLLDMPTGLQNKASEIIQNQKDLKQKYYTNEIRQLRSENEDLKKTIAINKNILNQVLGGNEAQILKTIEESVYTM